MRPMEKGFVDFMDQFKTEEDCHKHFFHIKWPGGFTCPKCKRKEYTLLKDRSLYQCRNCGRQTSITAGTAIHGSHSGLREWFLAVFLFTHDKKGKSPTALARGIGVSRFTAAHMIKKLRGVLGDADTTYYQDGIVTVDDALWLLSLRWVAFFRAWRSRAGGKRRKRGTSCSRQPL